MKKVKIRATSTVRRTGNRITAVARVSNGHSTKTITKSVKVPK